MADPSQMLAEGAVPALPSDPSFAWAVAQRFARVIARDALELVRVLVTALFVLAISPLAIADTLLDAIRAERQAREDAVTAARSAVIAAHSPPVDDPSWRGGDSDVDGFCDHPSTALRYWRCPEGGTVMHCNACGARWLHDGGIS